MNNKMNKLNKSICLWLNLALDMIGLFNNVLAE